MTGLRKRIAALALIAGMVAASGASLFAQPRHVVCESQHHECGQPASVSQCCCGAMDRSHDTSTPAEPRIELSSVQTIALLAPTVFNTVTHATLPCVASTSPPRRHRLDLPTLFACLLI